MVLVKQGYCYCVAIIFCQSLSVEKLSIYIELKEKIAVKRSRKFEAAHRQYIKMSLEDRKRDKFLQAFIDKRRDILFEISTRFFEEERKKAEEVITKVTCNLLFMLIIISAILLQEKERVLNVSLMVGLVPLSMVEQFLPLLLTDFINKRGRITYKNTGDSRKAI